MHISTGRNSCTKETDGKGASETLIKENDKEKKWKRKRRRKRRKMTKETKRK